MNIRKEIRCFVISHRRLNAIRNLIINFKDKFDNKVPIPTDEQIDEILNRGVVWYNGMSEEEHQKRKLEYNVKENYEI